MNIIPGWISFIVGALLLSSIQCEIKTTIQTLFNKVKSMQVMEDTQAIPPFIWTKFKGNYESDVKMNFHGPPEMTAFRYTFGIFDNNMFATSWITSILLEAYKYGKAPKPSDQQIRMSVDAIMEHKNKNLKYQNSIMAFWPQILNETLDEYQSTPVNLLAMFNTTYLVDWDKIYAEMEKLGLGDVVSIMKSLLARRSGYENVFHIPPDFDDTSVNLGLGSLIRNQADEFPEANAAWQSKNSNLSSVYYALKHYSYRPFSADKRINTIDTRTYFYMRKFLEKTKSEGRNLSLVATWVQDLDEVRTMYYKGVVIPGEMNNVDITVSANVLYGITANILSGLVTAEVLEDKDIQEIYLNTSTMIAYQINTNFSGRPDLALTYYPSEMEFYWFVARTFAELRRYDREKELPHQSMRDVMVELGDVLRGTVTKRVVNASQTGSNGTIYYDDFLGDGDYTQDGKKAVYGEDRIFTTAMAVNALITTWTVLDRSSGQLIWEPDTPADVKTTVSKAVEWLDANVLNDAFKPWNAFFSGSSKGFGTSMRNYPANRWEYFNGTKVVKNAHGHTIRGMEGVESETWYQEQLMIPQGGTFTPVDFHGFNSYPEYFPFWCSEPYTYVTTMLALSKFSNIQ